MTATALDDNPPTARAGFDAIALRGVSKRFGDVQALDSLSLRAEPAKITVLLGPNGAGKTTAIRLITGAMPPDTGTVTTLGMDPTVAGEEVRRRCGVVSAKPALYDRLSGRDNLEYSAALYGVDQNVDRAIREAAARFGIDHALDQMVGGYSTGMKTRLALSRSLLHDPEILLYDEPTSGLDPESSQAVLSLIRELTRDGRTVVMCTHLLAEAEGLADHIVVLEAGRSLLAGSQQDLIRRYWKTAMVRITTTDLPQLRMLDPRRWPYELIDGGAEVEVGLLTAVPSLVRELVELDVDITSVEPHKPSLEDLYFRIRSEWREAGFAVQEPLA